jgi:hypothetical protein
VLAPNGFGSAALPSTELAYTLFNDVPGHSPLTFPCSIVFDPVMYPIQYCVLALSVGHPFPDNNMLFHPALGVSVVVPVWHSRLPGDPELSA